MRSGSSDPTVTPRHTTTQRRLLTVFAGIGVTALTGVAFVLSYDDLRALALAGRAATRYAPAYPIMFDALIVVTILSLLVARNARWWSRWTRWLLLLILLNGAAAASVQRAVRGYDSLPDQALVAGVAAAPHVMLVIAVWLWLAMFRQARSALARRGAPRLGPVAKVAEELPGHAAYEDGDLVPGMREAPAPVAHREPEPVRPTESVAFEDTEPSVRILSTVAGPPGAHPAFPPQYSQPAHPPPLYRQPTYSDHTGYAESSEAPAEPDRINSDHDALDPEPPTVTVLPNPPSEARPIVRAATTRPDIVMPDALDSAEDDVDDPVIERAEDPDAGDGEPTGGTMSPRLPEPPAEDPPGDDPDTAHETTDRETAEEAPEASPDRAFGDIDISVDPSGDNADYDVERWSVTAAQDTQRWADDAAENLSDDEDEPRFTADPSPDVEWPP
ncbi:MAG: DUF2637 domain-containing protein, partial [Actinomadura sp.]